MGPVWIGAGLKTIAGPVLYQSTPAWKFWAEKFSPGVILVLRNETIKCWNYTLNFFFYLLLYQIEAEI